MTHNITIRATFQDSSAMWEIFLRLSELQQEAFSGASEVYLEMTDIPINNKRTSQVIYMPVLPSQEQMSQTLKGDNEKLSPSTSEL